MTGNVEFNWDGAAVVDEVHARIAANMLEMADKVVDRAKYFARPHAKTGRLMESIGYDWNYQDLTIVFTVGVPYGIFVEYGTRNAPPYPYLRPAINAFGPIYGFDTETAFLNTPEYANPVLAVAERFSIPKTLNARQRARIKENRLYSQKYYQHPTGNVVRTKMHARRKHF